MILVYLCWVVYYLGNYNELHKSLIEVYNHRGKSLKTDEVYLISFKDFLSGDFTINDVCYIIRRSSEFQEFPEQGFLNSLIEKRDSLDFLECLKLEKEKICLETEYNN